MESNTLLFYSPNATGSVETLDDQTETESVVSFRRERPRHRDNMEQHGEKRQSTTRVMKTVLYDDVPSRFGTLPTSKRWIGCDIIKECWEVGKVCDVWKQTQRNREISHLILPLVVWTPSTVSQGPAWTARAAWSATWQVTRAPAQWWAASWKLPASATLRMTTPWAGEGLMKGYIELYIEELFVQTYNFCILFILVCFMLGVQRRINTNIYIIYKQLGAKWHKYTVHMMGSYIWCVIQFSTMLHMCHSPTQAQRF